MTAEGHYNIVWGGDFKDTLRFQTSNVSFSFDATFRFADYISIRTLNRFLFLLKNVTLNLEAYLLMRLNF